jgi:hypothetical protein
MDLRSQRAEDAGLDFERRQVCVSQQDLAHSSF